MKMDEVNIEKLLYSVSNSEGQLIVKYDYENNKTEINVNEDLLYDKAQLFKISDFIILNGKIIKKERVKTVLTPSHFEEGTKPCIEIVIKDDESDDIIYIHTDLPTEDESHCTPPYMVKMSEYDTDTSDEIEESQELQEEPLQETIEIRSHGRQSTDDEEFTYASDLEKIKDRHALFIPFIGKTFKHVSGVFGLIGLIAYVHMFFIVMNLSVGASSTAVRNILGSHFISDIIGLVVGLIMTHIVYSRVITRFIIKVAQKISYEIKEKNPQKSFFFDSVAEVKRKNAINYLNDIVEFENEPYVAHRMYEFIDLEKSTENELTLDYTKLGHITEKIKYEHTHDEDLSPKQQVMVNRVISDEVTDEDIQKFQSVIKEYHDTKSEISYQREFYKYDKLFAEKQHTSDSHIVEEFDKINEKLNEYYQEMEELKQEKMKDIEERIS